MMGNDTAKPKTQEGYKPSDVPSVVTSDANYYNLAYWKVPEDLKY